MDIKFLMSANRLKLNTGKTKIIVIAKKSVHKKFHLDSFNVAGVTGYIAGEPIGNLGSVFDKHLTMEAHQDCLLSSQTYWTVS